MRISIIFMIAGFISVSSCKAPVFTIGMTETEFLKHNKVEVVQSTAYATVYKKINYPFGAPPKTKFFYFTTGRLTRVDEGVYNPDIIIEKRER